MATDPQQGAVQAALNDEIDIHEQEKLKILTVAQLRQILQQFGDEQNKRLRLAVQELKEEIKQLREGHRGIAQHGLVEGVVAAQMGKVQQGGISHGIGQHQVRIQDDTPTTSKKRPRDNFKDGDGPSTIELSPEVLANIPEELPINCGDMNGIFLVHDYLKFARSAKCVRLPDGRTITGTQFEKEAGYDSVKKWKMSCRLQVDDVQTTVEKWLKANKLESGRGSRPPKDQSNGNIEAQAQAQQQEQQNQQQNQQMYYQVISGDHLVAGNVQQQDGQVIEQHVLDADSVQTMMDGQIQQIVYVQQQDPHQEGQILYTTSEAQA